MNSSEHIFLLKFVKTDQTPAFWKLIFTIALLFQDRILRSIELSRANALHQLVFRIKSIMMNSKWIRLILWMFSSSKNINVTHWNLFNMMLHLWRVQNEQNHVPERDQIDFHANLRADFQNGLFMMTINLKWVHMNPLKIIYDEFEMDRIKSPIKKDNAWCSC